MKLSESKEEVTYAFKMCFQELKDKGFQVGIDCGWNRQPDFSRGPILEDNFTHVDKFQNFTSRFLDNKIYGFRIYITKYDKEFSIDDIIENLLFTEDYIRDEFNLNIIHLQDNSQTFYNDIKYLPKYINRVQTFHRKS